MEPVRGSQRSSPEGGPGAGPLTDGAADAADSFQQLMDRLVPRLPRGWGASLQIEDQLTGSLDEVARGGHAVAERAHLLSLTRSAVERDDSEPWLLARLQISEVRRLPLSSSLSGERPLGLLLLLSGPDARRLDEAAAAELVAACEAAAVELERERSRREGEKVAHRLRRAIEQELSDRFAAGCLELWPELLLCAVLGVTEDSLMVLGVRRQERTAAQKRGRAALPQARVALLSGSHLQALAAGGAAGLLPLDAASGFTDLALFLPLAQALGASFVQTVALEPSGKLLGGLLLLYREAPTTEARAALSRLADGFGASLDRIRPERRQAATFLYLQDLLRSSGRALAPILQTVTEELVRFLGADAGVIALLDADTGRLLLSEAVGYGGTVLPASIALGEPGESAAADDEGGVAASGSIIAHVVRSGRPYVASDTRASAIYLPADPSICSEIGVPLRARGETFGVALASSRSRGYFSEDDIARFQIFADQLALAVDNARLIDSLRARREKEVTRRQRKEFGFDRAAHAEDLEYHFGNLIGDPSGPMGEVYRVIERVASREDDTVLIIGETGCGKEMIAHAIHQASPRRKRPMVATNFAALGGDPNLIQSELFGHERGSFTGAASRRKGCFESAHGSTLFIDEVGDIVPSVQVKLLRVLGRTSSREFSRLGGEASIRTNVRVLAATNKDLLAESKAGRFREDLYYRLSALVVRLPPLRARPGDIPLLVRHILAKLGRTAAPVQVHRGVDEILRAYRWPGNIRQLESVILRALALYGRPDEISADDVRRALENEEGFGNGGRGLLAPLACPQPAPVGWFFDVVWPRWRARELPLEHLEALVRQALADGGGFYSRAAALLGVGKADYQRFIDFLAHAGVKIDYRKYRKR
jgi:transcriptional regulator with GAF, ATPase, and Fis domain